MPCLRVPERFLLTVSFYILPLKRALTHHPVGAVPDLWRPELVFACDLSDHSGLHTEESTAQ